MVVSKDFQTVLLLISVLLLVVSWCFGANNDTCDVRGTPYQCKVCLPQHNDQHPSLQHCAKIRQKESMMQRQFYKLTNPKRPDEENANNEPLFPRLNQSDLNIAMKGSFGDDSNWFSNYYGMVQLLNLTKDHLSAFFGKKELNSFEEYDTIYKSFLITLQNIPSLKSFTVPSNSPKFFDIISNGNWTKDKYFVQRRLAGQCPYFLRLVNDKNKDGGIRDRKLLKQLSKKFKWDEYMEENYGITLKNAIASGRLYVLYHEEYSKLPQTVDIVDLDPTDDIKLRRSSSPISLFLLNDEHDLEVIAIQIDDNKDANVLTPENDEYEWLQAKASVEIVEMATCQLIGHLLDTHQTQELFCNIFRRHFGRLHPLYQIMIHHCEGTTTVGALGLGALLDHGRYMHGLFNIGYMGSRILVNEFYKKQSYNDADFEIQLKKQGLSDDSRIRYHPYRDDGRVIWNEIEDFAQNYVELYYKSDAHVIYDAELESFVNELSTDGTLTNGGKYKGFPAKFTNRRDVSKFLTRFIWLVVKHAINSYPLLPYGAYIPVAPTKLYDNPSATLKKNLAYNLANGQVTLLQEVLVFTLGGFRLNRLFDYAKKMDDKKARCLVDKTYKKLNICIQKMLEERNKQRFKNEDLTYQFMEPEWLPNSIHS